MDSQQLMEMEKMFERLRAEVETDKDFLARLEANIKG
jgi:hypothetical protein